MFTQPTKILSISIALSLTLAAALPAQAEIFIINTQTLEPASMESQSGTSLSNVQANRQILLNYYHYSERAQAAQQRRLLINQLNNQVTQWLQTGIDQTSSDNLKGQINQLNRDTQEAIKFLAPFTLPELRQLHGFEEQNFAVLEKLQKDSDQLKIVATPNPPPPVYTPDKENKGTQQ